MTSESQSLGADIPCNDSILVPQAVCDEDPAELVPEQYNYQSS